MKTPHEAHEERRNHFHSKMKAINPHREFFTILAPGAGTPHYIFTDGKESEKNTNLDQNK